MISRTQLLKRETKGLPATMPVLQQERKIMSLGKAHHWPFRMLGVAPVPEQPVFSKNWWLIPATLDTSPIPERALERVRALHQAGIRPKAFVIAHQAEKQLAPPPGTRIVSPSEYWGKRVGAQALHVLQGVATVAAIVAPILAGVLGTGLLLSFGATTALVADPVLCVVTNDDVWIQIDEWMA